MKKGTSQGRVEKQSNPARGARALTPNRQSVSVPNNYADSSDSALNPGTAPQQLSISLQSQNLALFFNNLETFVRIHKEHVLGAVVQKRTLMQQ
jgi:hypothetical protein